MPSNAPRGNDRRRDAENGVTSPSMRPAALGVCSSLWPASHPLGHIPCPPPPSLLPPPPLARKVGEGRSQLNALMIAWRNVFYSLFSDLIFLSDAVRMNGLVQPLASSSVLTTCA